VWIHVLRHQGAARTGTVHSFTVVHHSVADALDAVVPYTVVLVSLDAAPQLRVVGNLVGGPSRTWRSACR